MKSDTEKESQSDQTAKEVKRNQRRDAVARELSDNPKEAVEKSIVKKSADEAKSSPNE